MVFSGPFNVNKILGDGKGRWKGVKWIEEEIKKLAQRPEKIGLQDVMWAIRTPKLTGDTAGYGQVVPLFNPSHDALRMLWHSPIGAVASPFSPVFMGQTIVPEEFMMHRYLTVGESHRFSDKRKLNEKNLYQLRRKVGFVFQDYKLLVKKTVFENVAFAQQIVGANMKTVRTKTWNALKNVGLVKKKDSYPSQLSGGEQQRVSIARAIVNDPELILADEPTGNLDSEISKEILALFEKINQQGKTIIIATHSAEILREKERRHLLLKRGKLLQS